MTVAAKKLILVVGATGAQGMHVIPALLAPAEDGSPSPYAVRALTRDPTNRRAQLLASMGVELFKGKNYSVYSRAVFESLIILICRRLRQHSGRHRCLRGMLRGFCEHRYIHGGRTEGDLLRYQAIRVGKTHPFRSSFHLE